VARKSNLQYKFSSIRFRTLLEMNGHSIEIAGGSFSSTSGDSEIHLFATEELKVINSEIKASKVFMYSAGSQVLENSQVESTQENSCGTGRPNLSLFKCLNSGDYATIELSEALLREQMAS